MTNTTSSPTRGRTMARRWAELSPAERQARTVAGRYSADTRWERQADPEGLMSPADRAVAGAQLRDAHYAELLGQPA